MRGEGWTIACPGKLVASSRSNLARYARLARPLVTSALSFLVAQSSQRLAWVSQGIEKTQKWPFCPPFWVFFAFYSETSKKSYELRDNWLWSSIWLTKIKVFANNHPRTKIKAWQFLLFTYLFIENEKVRKDKDTNFILAISSSNRPLAETQACETCQKKECKRYQVHQTKDLKVLKNKEDIEVSTKDSGSLWKCKGRKTLIVSARQQTLIVLEK